MLKINLLPQEYKMAERTSFGMLLLLMLCTLLSVGSICFVAYLYLGVLNSAESRRNIAQEEFENLSPMAKYADDLLAEKREYMKRSEAIAQIENTRILWTKKIDQLCYVVNNEGDTARHWVWLKDLRVKMSQQGGDPGVEFKGYVAGNQYVHLSNFNEDLKNHHLYEDFCAISNPTGAIKYEKKMIPSEAIEFSWKIKLIDRSEQPQNAIRKKTAASTKKM